MKVYCTECENACSERADSCPTCGHPLRKSPWRALYLAGTFTLSASIIAAALLVRGQNVDSERPSNPTLPSAIASVVADEPPNTSAPPSTAGDDEPVLGWADTVRTFSEGPAHTASPYANMLNAGEPIVLGRQWRKTSKAFRDSLSQEHRTEWMRDCFHFAINAASADLLARTGMYGIPRGRDVGNNLMWEAIYNLSDDPAMKDVAYTQWNVAELRRFVALLTERMYERLPPGNSKVRDARRPFLRQLPIWRDDL